MFGLPKFLKLPARETVEVLIEVSKDGIVWQSFDSVVGRETAFADFPYARKTEVIVTVLKSPKRPANA